MDERDLTALLRRHAARHGVPGAAAGILRDGEAVVACHGLADVSTGAPLTPETRFGIGSLTKSMVATVVARLAGDGMIAFDDPVPTRVPELTGSTWAANVTLRDLLANRSRLPLSARLEFGFDERPEEDARALARLAADAAHGEPGPDAWSYSNVGWCLLGRAVETATETSFEEAMAAALVPAGLCETAFTAAAAVHRRARGHDPSPEGPQPVAPLVSRAYAPAGATVVSTAADMLRLASLHLDDPALAGLRAAQARPAIHGWLDAWCLGWARLEWPEGPVWGWDGVAGGERSLLRLLPDRRAAVVVLTNSGSGRAMCRSLLAELMPAEFGIAAPPPSLDPIPGAAGNLARFAGTYAWPDRRAEVEATATGLVITDGSGRRAAEPIDGCTFLVDAADPDTPTVTFGAFAADGRPGVLYDMLWALPRAEA